MPKQAKVGGHPGVEALVTQQPGEAGIKSVTVTLPLSLALDPDNAESDYALRVRRRLKDQCPEKSVIGTVTAVSPLLKTPLNGKVYFVKGVRTDPKSGRQIRTLPTLLIELRGEINVNLRATNSVPDNKHLTSTFPMIPDAPICLVLVEAQRRQEGHPRRHRRPRRHLLHAAEAVPCRPSARTASAWTPATTLTLECPLAVVSRTFTKDQRQGARQRHRTPAPSRSRAAASRPPGAPSRTATQATITAKLTAAGKRMRRAKQDVRVKATFIAKGTKKLKVAYSVSAKKVRR